MIPPFPRALFAGVLLAANATAIAAQPLEEVPFITSPDKVTLKVLSSAA